jgi:hypothetical protein
MKQVIIQSSGSFTMPKDCPGCGQTFKRTPSSQSEIKVAKTSSAPSDPASLPINLCDDCIKKVSNCRMMGNVGWALILMGFLGPLFLGMTSVPQIMQSAGSVCIGLLLLWLAEKSKRKRLGIRCKRLSREEWEFTFERDKLADEFQKLNS